MHADSQIPCRMAAAEIPAGTREPSQLQQEAHERILHGNVCPPGKQHRTGRGLLPLSAV